MVFHQYYLQCLSHASYLIGDESTGRAVVVDPQRDVAEYLNDADAHGLRIERVIETHFHADFLSGHLELARACGATISYGEAAAGMTDFPISLLGDREQLSLGDVRLEIRATPGHTPESISVVVYEHDADLTPYGVCTGDALFIGDVGRPDLLASTGVTADQLARQLFHSLHGQLLTLGDATRVFPAHGAGSACGKNLSSELSSTIGQQRRTNYALQPMTEQEFVQAVTTGQSVAPLYFAFAAHRNRQRRQLLNETEPPAPLSIDELVLWQQRGAVLLDTRDPADFAALHVRGSVNVGLGGRFAEYAGDVLRPEQATVLITDPAKSLESKVRLARIGFDRVEGALEDVSRVVAQRPDLIETADRVTAAQMAAEIDRDTELVVVDVRNPGEVADGTVPGAVTIPLPRLLERLCELDPKAHTIVYCGGGYRSSMAASTLRRAGFASVKDLVGGFDAWVEARLPIARSAALAT